MDATDYDGRAPLHLAACQGELNVVKFLVEKCAVNVGVKDRCVSTFSSSSLFSFFLWWFVAKCLPYRCELFSFYYVFIY